MTARTLTLLSPSPALSKSNPYAMDEQDIDYHMLNMSSMDNSQPSSHQSLAARLNGGRNLTIQPIPSAIQSLQTPEVRETERIGFFPHLNLAITPSIDLPTPSFPTNDNTLPTPTVDKMMNEVFDLQQSTFTQAAASYNQSEVSAEIPEPVADLFDMSQQHGPEYNEQSHLNYNQHYLSHPLTSAASPGHSSSASSSGDYGSLNDDSVSNELSTSPSRSASVHRSDYNHHSPGKSKNSRPTKKQQYQKMVEKKREMELENSRLKQQAQDYTNANRRLREKLLTLIQNNNRGIGAM